MSTKYIHYIKQIPSQLEINLVAHPLLQSSDDDDVPLNFLIPSLIHVALNWGEMENSFEKYSCLLVGRLNWATEPPPPPS